MLAKSVVMIVNEVKCIFVHLNFMNAWFFLSIVAPVGNKVGKAMERRPFVLYSLIGKMPIVGKSMEGGSGIFGMCNKCLIYSTLVLTLFCVEINEEDSNS